VRVAAPSLANALVVAQRLEGGRVVRLACLAGRFLKTGKGSITLTAIALAAAAMMTPRPYKVACECQIEPVTRRFVAAPFAGMLEKSLVKPGDIVCAGDVLALMDGREIRWKRAGIIADYNQATKKRDAAQASHSYADQQIAQLEMERLELELRLLDHHAENLEIKSPVAGIVTSGDLERAEGAPLAVGQTLLEIALLEKMIVEVAVPDDEVSYIKVGQAIDVRLDAYPGQSWRLQVTRIQPRSEIRNEDNVFLADAELDNAACQLRPGMKGRAKIVTNGRPFGWILFHKPWEYVVKKLVW
jgi:multidrug resistance efflux pump